MLKRRSPDYGAERRCMEEESGSSEEQRRRSGVALGDYFALRRSDCLSRSTSALLSSSPVGRRSRSAAALSSSAVGFGATPAQRSSAALPQRREAAEAEEAMLTDDEEEEELEKRRKAAVGSVPSSPSLSAPALHCAAVERMVLSNAEERIRSEYRQLLTQEATVKASMALSASTSGASGATCSPLISPVAQWKENMLKNRFRNILPAEATRVKLKSGSYINANYVGSPSLQRYICTQAPMSHTAADFWQMVWEKGTKQILMLCNLVERGKTKCYKYWHSQRYGSIVVSLTKTATLPGIIVRSLNIRHYNAAEAQTRSVVQIQFTEWPDFGVPATTRAMRNVLSVFEHYLRPDSLPVVHCSAGVGRTGTFAAIHLSLRSLGRRGSCNVRQIVSALRRQRPGMIQTEQQYAFVFRCVKDYLVEQMKRHNMEISEDAMEVTGGSEEESAADERLFLCLLQGRPINECVTQMEGVAEEKVLPRMVVAGK